MYYIMFTQMMAQPVEIPPLDLGLYPFIEFVFRCMIVGWVVVWVVRKYL